MNKLITTTLALVTVSVMALAQDVPQEVAKSDLPAKAPCLICTSGGEEHGEEKPAGGIKYKGKTYYFCNKKEIEAFKTDPELYVTPELPRPAPKLTAATLDGKTVSLADYKGKVVLVDFWATWCKPCVDAMPLMNKLQAEHESKGFTVLGVSIDEDTKKVAPFASRKKLAYPVLLDDAKSPSWYEFKAASIPAVYLIDREGQVIAQWRGKPDHKAIEEAVKKAVQG